MSTSSERDDKAVGSSPEKSKADAAEKPAKLQRIPAKGKG